MAEIQVSVVIPLLNEEESLRELYQRLKDNLKNCGTHEILFVDDGSRDGSLQILREAACP